MKSVFFTLLFFLTAIPSFSENIYSDQLKPGMKGYALTVFSGNEKVKVPVEILGIMKNQLPGENRVIIKCSGDVVEQAGIIQGMSGSPVYIDGKLAGAISYGWAFGKEPIGGMTPIENMLELIAIHNSQTKDSDIRFKKMPNLDSIFSYKERSFLSPELEKFFTDQNFCASGFETLPFSTMQSGTSDALSGKDLEEGDSLAIALVRGDLNLFSIGTVTHVKNNYILGFGHPLFSLGNVNLPMHASDIVTVYPSVQISNKIGVLGPEKGVIVQDRNAAVMGIKDIKARMLPVNISLNAHSIEKKYSVEVANHELLTPFLTNITFNNLFTASMKNIGYSSFNLKGRIEFENHNPIILESLISDLNFIPVSSNISSLVQAVMQNPFEPVRIKGINIILNATEELRQAQILKVKSSKMKVKPGEILRINVYIKPFQQEMFIKNVQLKIPEDAKPGKHFVEIGDGFSIMQNESKTLARRIESMDGFIRLVNTYLKNNKIYMSLSSKTTAMYIGESLQSSIPSSIVETVKPQAVHIPVSDKWKEFFSVNILSLDHVVRGYYSIPVEVVDKF